jgi:hypothetical protein
MANTVKNYQIWMEGFQYGGDTVKAQLVGEAFGMDFRDAVMRYYNDFPCNTFDPVELSDWKCRLFPSEEEARKSHG